MTKTERQQIIDLVKSEVVPAIGCTEPIAVALCVANAAEVLGRHPEKITVLLSANNRVFNLIIVVITTSCHP